MPTRRALVQLAGLVAVLPASVRAAADDLGRLRDRLREHFIAMAPQTTAPSLAEILARQDDSGRWADLEQAYGNQDGPKRYSHCLRIAKLAGAWHGERDPARRAQLRAAIERALAVWLDKPKPPSVPWFNLIGTPMALGQAAIILGDELSELQRQQVVAILKTCVRPDGTLDYAGSPATGENLVHEATLQVIAGILQGDAASVDAHVRLVEREIGPGRPESIQHDLSFHQHGPQLYSGGLYGVGFARDAAALVWACHGGRFSVAPQAVATLTRYVLDGQQPMTRGRRFDFTTAGRMVVWPGLEGPDPESSFGVESACDHLAAMGVPRRGELQRFAARLRGQAPASGAPSGHHVFWQSDYVAHARPGFMASARMSSTRTFGHESGNKQNEQGYHLGDGAMCLMRTGEEYHDIFPLWNWRRVPGVSCVDNPAVPFPLHNWGVGSQGGSDIAGGVSDGSAGAAAMELKRGGLSGRKAWFFLDDLVVCLGSGLAADDAALPVVTTVNQCWGRGELKQGAGWVHHDGVAYLFPKGGAVQARVERRTGAWEGINAAQHRMVRSDPRQPWPDVSGDVFTLWLEHGTGAAQAPGYCYVLAPGVDARQAAALQARAGALVLAQGPDVLAAGNASTVQAMLWTAGEHELAGGRRVEVSHPCLVQWRRQRDGRWRLAVGNPGHRLGELQVRVHDPAVAARPVEKRFVFADAATAGRPQLAWL